MKQITNTYRNLFSRSYENRSKANFPRVMYNQKHYADLGGDTSSDGIFLRSFVSRPHFAWEASSGVAKCRLFSRARCTAADNCIACFYSLHRIN